MGVWDVPRDLKDFIWSLRNVTWGLRKVTWELSGVPFWAAAPEGTRGDKVL